MESDPRPPFSLPSTPPSLSFAWVQDKDSSLRRGCVESDSSVNKMTASGYTRLYSGNTDCFIGNKSSVTSCMLSQTLHSSKDHE